MHHAPTFVGDLAVVLCVAAVTGVIARLLKQSTILGYLFAGLIVGPYLPIPVAADPERVNALAEFGVVLVMFAVGLELRISKLAKVLPTSGFTGLVQVSFLMWCGFSVGRFLDWNVVESLFLGACIAISSTMVVSKVFEQVRVDRDVREHVLGVLVIQDVVAIALIAAMTGVAAGGGLAPRELAWTLARLAAVLIGIVISGLLVVPRLVRLVVRLDSVEILCVVSIGVCFGIALLAETLGYSVALGAFLAGVLVAESGRGGRVEHLIQPVRDLFAAVFFVSIGMIVDPRQALAELPTTLLVCGVVMTAQLASVSIAGVLSGLGLRRSLVAGLSLGQVGEFAFILAGIGVTANAVSPSLQPVLVSVAVITAFTTPALLRSADRIVSFVDRVLPHRVQHLLGFYETWLATVREGRAGKETRGPTRRTIRALVLDAAGLTFLIVGSAVVLPDLTTRLANLSGVGLETSRLVLQALTIAASVPLVVGLVTNSLQVARLTAATIAPRTEESTRGGQAAARVFRVMVYLGIALGVGFPMIAAMRLLSGGAYGFVPLAVLVVGIGAFLWRSAGAMETEMRSGAEHIADVLARQTVEEEKRHNEPTLIPGLHSVVGLPLPSGAFAVGKTLLDLNVRALTGVTVVAIHRGGADVVLPTGREHFNSGDVLGLVGSTEAINAARDLLVHGPPTPMED